MSAAGFKSCEKVAAYSPEVTVVPFCVSQVTQAVSSALTRSVSGLTLFFCFFNFIFLLFLGALFYLFTVQYLLICNLPTSAYVMLF